jgi:hypothetical protein
VWEASRLVQIIWLPEAGTAEYHRIATFIPELDKVHERWYLEYRNDWGWELDQNEDYIRIVHERGALSRQIERCFTLSEMKMYFYRSSA